MIAYVFLFLLLLVLPTSNKHKHRNKAVKPALIKAKPQHRQTDKAVIEALQAQLEAACELGLALDKAAVKETDSVRRARKAGQSAAAYSKAAQLQARIDRLQAA